MKKILCALLLCAILLLTACASGDKLDTNTEETQTASEQSGQEAQEEADASAKEAFAASNPEHDTDIGLRNIKIDTAQAELTDQQKAILNYFDNDYLNVPDYEFLQRYPTVYMGANIHLDGEVKKIISEDGKRFEIVLWLVDSFTEYFVHKYPLDQADYYMWNFPEEYDPYREQMQGAYITVTGDLGDTWFVEGDHVEIYGRYAEIKSTEIDGTSHTMPRIEASHVYFWTEYDYDDCERYDVNDITEVAKAVFGDNVEVREAVYQEDMQGVQCGGFEDNPFYVVEPENQSNSKFTSYRFYTKRGLIEDTKTGTDWWLIGADPTIERYLEFSADFEHFLLFTFDQDMEKLTLDYYDKSFTKLWQREFDQTTSAHYDYTKNNIYLAANNSLYIINMETGEDTFSPAFIGEKQEIRKMNDGVLSVGKAKADAVIKTDLDGNLLWKTSLPQDITQIDGIQFVDDHIILQLELFDGLHFVVIDSVTGNLMQDAVSIS